MATIGVTGHRILCDVEKLQKSIDDALRKFLKKFGGKSNTLLTSLAEGSDRIVAAQVLSMTESRIVAVLPLPSSEYIKDFESQESRIEFWDYLESAYEVIQMEEFPERDAAYEAAGLYVVDHCDGLICIWDGQGAQGRGGTGFIVERARKRGIPVAWIHAGNRRPGTMDPTSLGAEQGQITYENF